MKTSLKSTVAVSLVLGLIAFPAGAFHCPNLVKECEALAGKLAAKPGVDKAALAKAKQGCAEALTLHKAGKHKASVIKAGEAISAAGAAVK